MFKETRDRNSTTSCTTTVTSIEIVWDCEERNTNAGVCGWVRYGGASKWTRN